MIYSKHGLFLEKVIWFFWKLVFNIHRDYKYVQRLKYSLWGNEEKGEGLKGVEVGHADFMILKELRNPS